MKLFSKINFVFLLTYIPNVSKIKWEATRDDLVLLGKKKKTSTRRDPPKFPQFRDDYKNIEWDPKTTKATCKKCMARPIVFLYLAVQYDVFPPTYINYEASS